MLFVAQVITECVRTFVDAQLRFFQSAAGQLAQFFAYLENADCNGVPKSTETVASDDLHVTHQLANVNDMCVTHQASAPVNELLRVGPSNYLNKPPGLSVSPQLISAQTAMERSQRSAGDHCITFLST